VPYLTLLGIAAGEHARGSLYYYPTHFVHAVRAAQAAGRSLNALLFENDEVSGGRRAAIESMLARPPAQALFGINPDAWTGTLADPGNFREPTGWARLNAAVGTGDVLVILSDPMRFNLGTATGADMGPSDLELIGVQTRTLQPAPSLVVHVIFVTSNLGVPATGNVHPYAAYVQDIVAHWTGLIAPAGAVVQAVGVQWGAFLALVAAYEIGPSAASVASAFQELRNDIQATLVRLWPGDHHQLW
jgi:hypothetical protein